MKRFVKTPIFISAISVLLVLVIALGTLTVVFGVKNSRLENRVTEAIAAHNGDKAIYDAMKKQNGEILQENAELIKENNNLKIKLEKAQKEIENTNKLLKKVDNKKLIEAEKALAAELELQPLSEPSEKVCYLTFDDGPSDRTPEILDILERYEVKATFFVVGSAKLEYLPRIAEKGHAIGLHANSHDYSKIYKSTTAYFNDLNLLSDKVYEKIGVHPKIIRFPGGSSNKVSQKYKQGIMTRLTSQVQIKGYAYFDWNVDSTDASGKNIPKEKLVSSVLTAAEKKNSICVLMHDTSSKHTTVEALTEIIVGLQKMGYCFKALDETCFGYHHTVRN
ncbi:MAG: polysaccharide deacetylase family protein [Clostridia bacterium]|nr:polysaccharide deacetylase family protein [Clostridia bacterium]